MLAQPSAELSERSIEPKGVYYTYDATLLGIIVRRKAEESKPSRPKDIYRASGKHSQESGTEFSNSSFAKHYFSPSESTTKEPITTPTTTPKNPSRNTNQDPKNEHTIMSKDTMDLTSETSQQVQQNSTPLRRSTQPPTLQVNFSWRKFESLVSEKREGDQSPKPLYIVDYHTLKIKPKLIFKSATDNLSTFGTGILHPISINCDCEIRGKPVKLQATSRIKTQYMHLSHNFSDTNEPVPMTWTSAANFKTWDFVCLDQNQQPVARFAANVWAVKKVGNIEFLGERTATSEAAREEIVIMGMTLFSCMMLRMNNFFSLFGMIPSPAKVEDYRPVEGKDALNGAAYTINDNGVRVAAGKERVEDYRPVEGKDAFNGAKYTINDNGARVAVEKEKVESRAEPVGH